MDQNTVLCPQCGTENKATTKFCRSCGANITADAPVEAPVEAPAYEQPAYAEPAYAEPVYEAPKKAKKEFTFFKTHPLKNLIKVSVTLLIAIVMLFSCFSSVVKYRVELNKDQKKYFNTKSDYMDIKFSPVDLALMAFDSFQFKEEEDIYDDWEDKLDALEEEFEEAMDDKKDMRKLLVKQAIYDIRMGLQSENTIPNLYLVVAGGFSLAYLILSIVFIIKAILAFIAFFTKKDYNPKSNTVALLCKIGSLSLAVFFMAKIAIMGLGFTVEDPKTQAIKMGGAGTVLTFVIIAVVGLLVARFFFEKVDIKRLVFNTVSTVCAVLCMCALFMPLVSASAKVTWDGKDKATEGKTSLRYEDLLCSFEEDFDSEYSEEKSAIRQMLSMMGESTSEKNLFKYYEMEFVGEKDFGYAGGSLSYYTQKEFEKGDANGEVLDLYKMGLTISTGSTTFTMVGTLFYMFVIFTASIIFSQGLANIATGKRSMGKTVTAKIFTAVLFGIGTLMMVILPMLTFAYTNVAFGLGSGIIVFLIALVLVIACPAGNEKYVDAE